MKKIIIPFVLLAASMAFSSCEDLLTKSPETSLSPDTYFSSERELDLWANKFYNDILPSPGDLVELNADDNGSSSSLSALQKGTRTPSSKSWSADTWKPLRNINYMLENNKCSDAAVKARRRLLFLPRVVLFREGAPVWRYSLVRPRDRIGRY